MSAGCQAGVSFNMAPYLLLRCHRPPGHDGLHEASAKVPTRPGTADDLAEEFFRSMSPRVNRGGREFVDVWLTWELPEAGGAA